MKKSLSVPSALLLGTLLCGGLLACAGSKADAQLHEQECDVVFEYHAVENDSIALLIGNTLRLHAGKAHPASFYPLLLSVRDPQELDRPTSTEVLTDAAALRALLQQRFPMLHTIGITIGENARTQGGFSESDAISPIRTLAQGLPEVQLYLFQEKGGEVQSYATIP